MLQLLDSVIHTTLAVNGHGSQAGFSVLSPTAPILLCAETRFRAGLGTSCSFHRIEVDSLTTRTMMSSQGQDRFAQLKGDEEMQNYQEPAVI